MATVEEEDTVIREAEEDTVVTREEATVTAVVDTRAEEEEVEEADTVSVGRNQYSVITVNHFQVARTIAGEVAMVEVVEAEEDTVRRRLTIRTTRFAPYRTILLR